MVRYLFRSCAIVFFIASIVWLVLGYFFYGLLVACIVLLGWHLYHLHLLISLLINIKIERLPDIKYGIWAQIYTLLYRRRKKRKQREQRIKDVLAPFYQAALKLPDAIIALNSEHRIEWANDSAVALFNLQLPRDYRRSITHLIRHPAFLEYVQELHFMTQDVSVDINMYVKQPQYLRLKIVEIGVKKQRLLFASDITQSMVLEKMRKDFVANASHELKTPLTVLHGYLELLQDNTPISAQILQDMQQQTTRMMTLVDNLLTLSLIESRTALTLEYIDLTRIIDTVLQNQQSIIAIRKNRIIWQHHGSIMVLGSVNAFEILVTNLLTNAVMHNPEGTTILISLNVSDTEVILTVEDKGIGIAECHLSRLTERFYRVPEGQFHQGTGLGLSIVKHICLKYQGHINIDSQVGSGTRVRCTFLRKLDATLD